MISLYGKGMSFSDIEEELQKIYGRKLSTTALSIIPETAIQRALDWQNSPLSPLEPVYLIVWMGGIVSKVMLSAKVINKTVYLAVGLHKRRSQRTFKCVAWR